MNTRTFESNCTLYPPAYPFKTAVTPRDTRTREHQMSLRTATAAKNLAEVSLTFSLNTRVLCLTYFVRISFPICVFYAPRKL